ncbi:MAG: hypothetical protein LBQ56_03160 [Synergistaceae bacterium]|jgi:hypothetical protein|nr:hypothetical protein [Synergistaceae bacterium]
MPLAISYPCGSYDADTVATMEKLGVPIGFDAKPSACWGDRMHIPREDHSNVVSEMKGEGEMDVLSMMDDKYEFRLADVNDIDSIKGFIGAEWKSDHILAVDRDFFCYQHMVGDKVNFLLAEINDGIIRPCGDLSNRCRLQKIDNFESIGASFDFDKYRWRKPFKDGWYRVMVTRTGRITGYPRVQNEG